MTDQEKVLNPDTPEPKAGAPEAYGPASGPSGTAGEKDTALPRGKRKVIFLVLALVLSFAGLFGFVWLFLKDFNVYWLILSPIIIALYQIPAVFLFWLYKRSGGRPSSSPAYPETPAP